jgi:hypothetical protein
MSAPTKRLGKLSIGADTSTSRSHPREGMEPRDPKQGYPSDSSSDEESSSDEAVLGPVTGSPSSIRSLVEGQSTITYDLRKLSSDTRPKAVAGLKGSFDVERCRERRDGYDFQLADRGRVHINSDGASCTCSDFQDEPGVACRHIFVSTLASTVFSIMGSRMNSHSDKYVISVACGPASPRSSAKTAPSRCSVIGRWILPQLCPHA